MSDSSRPLRLTVDSQTWEVVEHSGLYTFTWLSGPDPGYGFSTRLSDPETTLSLLQIETAIRNFLSNINPETGHLD